jgi:hypothetical protein
MALLAAKSVGRIAYTSDAGARILPVNYILLDDCIIFRTVPDGEIFHHALDSICAFEIDETDEFFLSGWSVVAVGRCNWRPKMTLLGCGSEDSLNHGPAATDTCSYDCRASKSPDEE